MNCCRSIATLQQNNSLTTPSSILLPNQPTTFDSHLKMSSEAAAWTPPPFGSPCWIEIPAVDVPALKKFYSALFPTWAFKPATEDYPDEKLARFNYSEKSDLGGGITQVGASCKGTTHPMGVGATIYHLVEDIDTTKEKAVSLGGKALSETKEPEGSSGFYMYLVDPEGNRFGIYEVKK